MSDKIVLRRFLYHNTDARIEEMYHKIEDLQALRRKHQRKKKHRAWIKEQREKEIEKQWREQITQWAAWSDVSLKYAVFDDNNGVQLRQMKEALNRSEHSKTWRNKLKEGIEGGLKVDVFPIFNELIIVPKRKENAAKHRAWLEQSEADELKRTEEEKRKEEEVRAAVERSNRERQERLKEQGMIFGEVSDSDEEQNTSQNTTNHVAYAGSSSETDTPQPPDNLDGLLKN